MGLDDIKKTASDAGQDFKERSEDAFHNTKETLGEAGAKGGQKAEDLKDNAEDHFDRDNDK